MKSLGKDKNGVQIYECDVVIFDGIKYRVFESFTPEKIALFPYVWDLSELFEITIVMPGDVELAKVSDLTD